MLLLEKRTCKKCHRELKKARWRRFKNGTFHLVKWCQTCERFWGNPIPPTRAAEFGAEDREVAIRRLTVQHDQTWGLFTD
jgi:hypothetical protein